MSEYLKSNILEEIAQQVINEYPLDSKIKEAKIVYLFSTRKKSNFAGKIQKPGGTWKYLSDYDFVVIIHQESWNNFAQDQKKALLYHELSHVFHKEKDNKIIWKLRVHDVEEFINVVEHFGYWSPMLKELKKTNER